MKIYEFKNIFILALLLGLVPNAIVSDNTNPHLLACLAEPDNNPASTALACAFAFEFFTRKQKPAPDDLRQRIGDLKNSGEMHAKLRSQILDTMRLNRRAFQSEKVINRYGDSREQLADTEPVLKHCGLPRDSNGHPLPQYSQSFENPDHGIRADYSESKGVLRCLETRSGLAGVRAEPLAQHYYCTLPGNSPEIRSCFTFQIRVSSNTRSNSHKNIFVRDAATDSPRIMGNAKKEWLFAGTQKDFQDAKDNQSIPQHVLNKVANYCSSDGRAARVTDLTVDPPVSYWHTDFLNHYLQQTQRHQDPAVTNQKLIDDYLKASSGSIRSRVPLLNIDRIDPDRSENSRIKAPLCWINQTQRSVFQLMLSPAITIYFDREDQASLINDYYQCHNDTIRSEYRKSGRKMRNYCPENFDQWD